MDAATTKQLAQWRDLLERATGFDSWGQVVEAADEYEKLTKSIKRTLDGNSVPFTDDQARFVGKLATAAQLRASAAQNLSGDTSLLDVTQVKHVLRLFPDLLTGQTPEFPFQIAGLRRALPAQEASNVPADASDDEDDDVQGSTERGGGTLLPKKSFPGKTSITIRIDKIQLKDPGQYIEPFFSISVKDMEGRDLCRSQDTPVTNTRSEFIHFKQDVHLPVPLEDLAQGAGIFFEFKHYKPKKHKISTKCYSFMEPDELVNGPVCLEIYAKPTDFRRKKFHLLTEKPHYLHLTITTSEDQTAGLRVCC